MEDQNVTPAASSDQGAGDQGGQPASTGTPESTATSVSSPSNAVESPANTTGDAGQAGQDWQKKYSETQAAYEKQLKSFNDLRAKLVSQGTEKNKFAEEIKSMKTQLQQVADALAKATAAPYDPDQFMEDLRTQGPKALENHLKSALEKQQKAAEDRIRAVEEKYKRIQTASVVKDCRTDTKNYPDFEKLEETMAKIVVELRENFSAGIGGDPDAVDPEELIPFLYNEAKTRHSQDALKAAEAHGAAKATADLAKEANTAVASGGKNSATTTIDPSKLSSADLRKHFMAQGLVES